MSGLVQEAGMTSMEGRRGTDGGDEGSKQGWTDRANGWGLKADETRKGGTQEREEMEKARFEDGRRELSKEPGRGERPTNWEGS